MQLRGAPSESSRTFAWLLHHTTPAWQCEPRGHRLLAPRITRQRHAASSPPIESWWSVPRCLLIESRATAGDNSGGGSAKPGMTTHVSPRKHPRSTTPRSDIERVSGGFSRRKISLPLQECIWWLGHILTPPNTMMNWKPPGIKIWPGPPHLALLQLITPQSRNTFIFPRISISG